MFLQTWKAVSQFSRKDYTGEYTLNLIPCTVQPTQGYEPSNLPDDETTMVDPPCSAQPAKVY